MPHILELRRQALTIFQAGVAAADPYQAVSQCLRCDGRQLSVKDATGVWLGQDWAKIHVIAIGKAASAMASAALDIIPKPLLAGEALIVTNAANHCAVPGAETIAAGHPLPDTQGLAAALRVKAIASQAQHQELLLVLISGGGSSLLPCPVPGLELADKIAVTELLLACGAPIHAINGVRKHLSQLKGGGLARLAFPASVQALILSDVVGDDLSAIASGPTVADPSTYADAVAVLHEHGIWAQTPKTVQTHLLNGVRGKLPETPKADAPCFGLVRNTLVGSNRLSLAAMEQTAQTLGYPTLIYHPQLVGEAREVAKQWAKAAVTVRAPVAMLAGGETTVTLRGQGLGGRNQEMALAFALALYQQPLSTDWVFLSAGTDGRDGPTDAAGGLVDVGSIPRMIARCDPNALLADNDSYHALANANDLLLTGATGTNVADLQLLLLPRFSS